MKHKNKINLLIAVIAALIIIPLFTVSPNAAVGETGRDKDQQLMPGVWESTVYVTESRDNNVRVHIVRINKGSNVAFKVSNASYYTKGSTASSRASQKIKWGYANVLDQAASYEAVSDREGTVVAAVNGDFYLKDDYNGQTEGKMIIEGNVINPSQKEPFFAVLKDGSYDLREGKANTSDVQEAVGGFMWVLRDNVNNGNNAPQVWDTVNSIGLTDKGDVVMVAVDGRESSSAGMTVYDLGVLMKKQGCTDAILLDCGGSSSFLTKRLGDTRLKYRNVPNDGVPRPVSTSILVVRKNAEGTQPVEDTAAVSMKEDGTQLVENGGVYYYTANGRKISGFRIVNNEQYLFDKNGKGMTKTVSIGKTKYYYKKGKLRRTTDRKAGRIAIGFCGTSNNGQNLLYAYHYGDKILNIGLNPLISKNNGKMKNWGNVIDVPWASEIRLIKEAYVGDGVKNLGGHALYISPNPFNPEAKKLGSSLKKLTLPASLTGIGGSALTNNQKLRSLTIPKNVKSIGKNSLTYNKAIRYTFKSRKPPVFSGKVFNKTGGKVVIVAPGSSAWKAQLGGKAKKKIGFKGKVKYTK